MRRLTLFIPGLTGPAVPMSGDDLPSFPAMEWILGKSGRKRHDSRSYYSLIGELMGVSAPPGRDLPVAPVTRLIDSEEHPEGVWMRADPVHLSADRDRLVLLESSIFPLTQHDALAVATEVQQVLDADAWRLEVPYRDRWYIRLANVPDVTTTDLAQVAGQDIDDYLPAGGEATTWHRLLNEIQMQLHECEINRERESRGELPINSLWFWGIGELPVIPPRVWLAVYSDDCFAAGLAMLSMTPCREVPAGLQSVLDDMEDQADILVHLNACRKAAQYMDLQLWYQSLLDLESEWFGPALQALQQNDLQQLDVRTEYYRFTLTRPALKKFWRRPKSVARFNLSSEA